MRCLPLFALVLAMSACSNPTIPDPRFEMPVAPSILKEPVKPLEPIVTPDQPPRQTQKPDENGLIEINLPNSARI